MFATPVGGAALLGLGFTLILLWLLFAAIADRVKSAIAGVRSWRSPAGPAGDPSRSSRIEAVPFAAPEELPAPDDQELESQASDAAYRSVMGDLESEARRAGVGRGQGWGGTTDGWQVRAAARDFFTKSVWHQVEHWRRTQLELARLKGVVPSSSYVEIPPTDAPIHERKARLVAQWRMDIQDAQSRSHTYRPGLGDARPRLEDYGLKIDDTVEERELVYRECAAWCREANDAYDSAYYRVHGRIPHRPSDLRNDLDRPQPPQPEDFWLTVEASEASPKPLQSP